MLDTRVQSGPRPDTRGRRAFIKLCGNHRRRCTNFDHARAPLRVRGYDDIRLLTFLFGPG